MPYDEKDPRAKLNPVSTGNAKAAVEFAGVEYAKFYETEPNETMSGSKTWYVRGQNFIVAYTEASAGAVLSRSGQPDEYVVLLPDPAMSVEITADDQPEKIEGYSLCIVPPGDSNVRVLANGSVVRLFTVQSGDLAERCSNASSYATPHPNVAPYEPWPEPIDGFKVRAYSLDVPPQEGRFGRIWRCSTFMVNYLNPYDGPRDATKMSPHSHDDLEQCSLVLSGEYRHNFRWPWIPDMTKWREDEHELCRAPSVVVIPPPAIHTSQAVGKDINQMVDIFCPPRMDFSKKPGWVLNSDAYPMPEPI